MSTERLTNQKVVILEYLRSTREHPSAYQVYKKVKTILPQISQATVYRILNQFVEKGIINEITVDQRRFDGNISEHAHFVCQKCHQITDINLNKKSLSKIIPKHPGVKITGYQVIIYGICNKCRDS